MHFFTFILSIEFSQPLVIFRCGLRNVIYDVLNTREGWRQTDSDTDWDLNWADVGWIRDFYDHIQMDDHQVFFFFFTIYFCVILQMQRVNHFRNHYEITRKDLMVKNFKRMRKNLERTDCYSEAAKYGFFPATFVLPSEYGVPTTK